VAGLYRSLITGGGLQRLIDEDGLGGVTSNPTILDKAIAEQLQADGINAFATSFDQLLATLVHTRRHILT
jgi:transaldolase